MLIQFCPHCKYFVIKDDGIEEEVGYLVKWVCDDHKHFPTKFAALPKICTDDGPPALQCSSIFLLYIESSAFFCLNIHCYPLKGRRSKEVLLRQQSSLLQGFDSL